MLEPLCMLHNHDSCDIDELVQERRNSSTLSVKLCFSCINSSTYYLTQLPWWRHPMETFSVLLALCAGNSLVTGKFPSQRPVTQRFDFFFYLCLNQRLSRQLWDWWFETLSRSLWFEMLSRSLWRHSNVACGQFHASVPFYILVFRWNLNSMEISI